MQDKKRIIVKTKAAPGVEQLKENLLTLHLFL